MRPKKHKTTGSSDLFRARFDQIINLKHELAYPRMADCSFCSFASCWARSS
jgi:hypothetical protein